MGRALSRDIRLRLGTWAPLLATAALLAQPAFSDAATVSVSQASATEDQLRFEAAPGETNHVTISVPERVGNTDTVEVIDSGAPLEAGLGCAGGGGAGAPVRCSMEAPRIPEPKSCGHGDCIEAVPGTEWHGTFNVELGDGDDSLDASAIPTPTSREYPFVSDVLGGPGNDTIVTGQGDDVIDPGTGFDRVFAGDGTDVIKAGSAPDGPDIYDLGPNPPPGSTLDEVDYSGWSLPVNLENGVVDGEDTLEEAVEVTGGSGDDALLANPPTRLLNGGPGDDLLRTGEGEDVLDGGEGDDRLFGGGGADTLYGGRGNDILHAGPGADHLSDSAPHEYREPNVSNDLAYGEGGGDVIDMGAGDDKELGGAGADRLLGGPGNDLIDGGLGADRISGEGGSDRLRGGPGRDELFSSRAPQKAGGPFGRTLTPIDTARDRVDCGGDRDFASVNPWDSVSECEREALHGIVEIRAPRYESTGGSWLLPIFVASPGLARVHGPGLRNTAQVLRTSHGNYLYDRKPFPLPLRLDRAGRTRLRDEGELRIPLVLRFTPATPGTTTRAAHRTVVLRAPNADHRH